MSASNVLPDAAREQAWRLLWQRLLQAIPDDDRDPDHNDSDDEERPDEAA